MLLLSAGSPVHCTTLLGLVICSDVIFIKYIMLGYLYAYLEHTVCLTHSKMLQKGNALKDVCFEQMKAHINQEIV